jgi:hypothetical protein
MTSVNTPGNKYFGARHVLDSISVLLFMIPFYVGMHFLFKERLRFGREYVASQNWKAAVAALEPFDSPTQKFLDGTGEAHYLLALAYGGAGQKVKAEKIKTFVQKHRKGVWADKLKGVEPPRVSSIKAARASENATQGSSESPSSSDKQGDKFSRPATRVERPKSSAPAKRKKRF